MKSQKDNIVIYKAITICLCITISYAQFSSSKLIEVYFTIKWKKHGPLNFYILFSDTWLITLEKKKAVNMTINYPYVINQNINLVVGKNNISTMVAFKFVALLNEFHKTFIHGLQHGLNPWTFE
mgnify:CR=1 FL=1